MNRPEGKSFFQGAERGGWCFGEYRGFCAILPPSFRTKANGLPATPPPHGTNTARLSRRYSLDRLPNDLSLHQDTAEFLRKRRKEDWRGKSKHCQSFGFPENSGFNSSIPAERVNETGLCHVNAWLQQAFCESAARSEMRFPAVYEQADRTRRRR
jgi:hypothetical protein